MTKSLPPWRKVDDLLFASGKLDQDQEAYAIAFGRKVHDRSINAEIDKLLRDGATAESNTVSIPIELLFAITLRKKWLTQGRRELPRFKRRGMAYIIQKTLQREIALSVSVKPNEAKRRAAEEAQEALRDLGLPMDIVTIKKQMRMMKASIAKRIDKGLSEAAARKEALAEAARRPYRG